MNVSGGVATRIRVSNATSNSQSGWNNCQGEGFQAGDTITFSSGTFGGTQDLIITLTAVVVLRQLHKLRIILLPLATL